MPFEHVLLILLVGIIAGFISVLAGGGSLLTMPMLIFLGLPSATANGTNRIALVVQNIVAIINFKHKGYFDWKLSLMLAFPAVIGSIIGANLAISLPDQIFNKILGIVMLIVLAFTLFKPLKNNNFISKKELNLKIKLEAILVFFFVGIYGGFIQAGIGFIIIATLAFITSISLVKINSIKVFVIACYMISSLFIFIINGQVNWLLGIILAIGNGIGGWLGSNFAVAKGDKGIRFFLFITVILMAAKLMGIFEVFAFLTTIEYPSIV